MIYCVIPRELEALGCETAATIDRVHEADVIYVLRMQQERMRDSFVPSLREYASRYQITPARLRPGTRARDIYGEEIVYERHRHRFEVNNRYRQTFEEHGLVCSGTSPDDRLVEVIELPADQHPFFVASQYHPEFKSRPERPAPLFREFVGAVREYAGAPAQLDHGDGARAVMT